MKKRRNSDDEAFARDMAKRAEYLNDLFERIPEPKWVPCPKGKHHINATGYPHCIDCDRERFDREQRARNGWR